MEKIKINMGCGWRNFGKDWVHIDGGDYPHLDSKDIFILIFSIYTHLCLSKQCSSKYSNFPTSNSSLVSSQFFTLDRTVK